MDGYLMPIRSGPPLTYTYNSVCRAGGAGPCIARPTSGFFMDCPGMMLMWWLDTTKLEGIHVMVCIRLGSSNPLSMGRRSLDWSRFLSFRLHLHHRNVRFVYDGRYRLMVDFTSKPVLVSARHLWGTSKSSWVCLSAVLFLVLLVIGTLVLSRMLLLSISFGKGFFAFG